MADVLLASVLITICVLGAELTMRVCRRWLSRPLATGVPGGPARAERAVELVNN